MALDVGRAEVVGLTEVAEILGVSRQRVVQIRNSHPDFPKPAAQLARGALWDAEEIREWAKSWDRSPRPKTRG